MAAPAEGGGDAPPAFQVAKNVFDFLDRFSDNSNAGQCSEDGPGSPGTRLELMKRCRSMSPEVL